MESRAASEGTDEGAIVIPEPPATLEHASQAELDEAVGILAKRKDDWVALGLEARITLLDQMIRNTVDLTEEWASLAMQAKGVDPASPAGGEDIATGPMQLIRTLRLFKETLESLRDSGEVELPGEPRVRDDGQVVVPVFPTSKLDMALYAGHKAELWLQKHVTLETMEPARRYKDKLEGKPLPPGKVCFVLGAGNISSIGAIDALQKLYADDEVVVLKMNPVNEYIGPVVSRALAPLIREGYLRIVYGGASEGQYLVDHPDVDTLHMTGSDKTHDVIVFGAGDEGRERKHRNEPIITKPFTSELGNVTPIIIVPGPWTDDDIAYHGKYIASMMTNNGGFNCGAGRMIVTHRRWKLRTALLDAVRASLREAEQRPAYYPGARDRWERFVEAHPEAETFGTTAGDAVPWTLIPDLDPDERDDIAFRVEAFNGIQCETALDAPLYVPAFIRQAVDFCNDTLWGTLAATILVHPKTLKDSVNETAVEDAIAGLEYGAVGVNVWAAVSYGLGSTTWGAFPGHPLNDIQSGRGWVHNSYLLPDPEKTVVRAPWRLGKKPPMSYDFTTFPSLARRMVRAEAFNDWTQLPGIVMDGIKA